MKKLIKSFFLLSGILSAIASEAQMPSYDIPGWKYHFNYSTGDTVINLSTDKKLSVDVRSAGGFIISLGLKRKASYRGKANSESEATIYDVYDTDKALVLKEYPGAKTSKRKKLEGSRFTQYWESHYKDENGRRLIKLTALGTVLYTDKLMKLAQAIYPEGEKEDYFKEKALFIFKSFYPNSP